MNFKRFAASLLVLISATTLNASAAEDAAQKTELVTKLNEYTIGELERPLVLKHLATFDMSPAWWTKIQEERGTHALSFFSRDMLDFGKQMGWGDAYQYSNSGSGSKDEWKPRIETMLTGWKPKFTFEIKPDTPACDNMNFDLSMRYLTTIGSVMKDWKPSSGQAHVVYVPSATAKDISVTKSPDGKIVVKAPINSEPSEWDSKIEKGFKRLANPL
jgi:hypothetical protein